MAASQPMLTLVSRTEEPTAAPTKTRQQFAEEITRVWQRNVESIIDTGRLVWDAREGPNKLPHGDFTAMVEKDLPFGPHTARRLIAIAKNDVISNRAHGLVLPASWRTLYELTRLPIEILEAKIADGPINPRMERKEAIALRRPPPEEPEGEPAIKLPGGVHADCVRLESLAESFSDNAVASAINKVMTAARRAPDTPRQGDPDPAEAWRWTIMELERWAAMLKQGKAG